MLVLRQLVLCIRTNARLRTGRLEAKSVSQLVQYQQHGLLYMSTLLLFINSRNRVRRSEVSTFSISNGLCSGVDIANALTAVVLLKANGRKRVLIIGKEQSNEGNRSDTEQMLDMLRV